MLITKPGILLSTCNTLQSLPNSISASSTSSTRSTRPHQKEQKRHATITNEPENQHKHHEEPERPWPKPLQGQTHPTPYQIFALKRTATYNKDSKAKYYALVKLYHPDRNGSSCSPLPQNVKAERYRLIVAAHTILSDPVKRSAYDRFGAGWNGKAEVNQDGTVAQASAYHQTGPFTHSWNKRSDPIWQNATWEDWERFYARRAGDTDFKSKYGNTRRPVYMQNTYFLALIVMLAMMGSSANYSRAQDAGANFVEQRDVVHDKAAKELRKVRQQRERTMGSGERIQWFLRQREATLGLAGSDMHTMREEQADRLLPNRDVCRSEDVSERVG